MSLIKSSVFLGVVLGKPDGNRGGDLDEERKQTLIGRRYEGGVAVRGGKKDPPCLSGSLQIGRVGAVEISKNQVFQTKEIEGRRREIQQFPLVLDHPLPLLQKWTLGARSRLQGKSGTKMKLP